MENVTKGPTLRSSFRTDLVKPVEFHVPTSHKSPAAQRNGLAEVQVKVSRPSSPGSRGHGYEMIRGRTQTLLYKSACGCEMGFNLRLYTRYGSRVKIQLLDLCRP